ncbi:unnamed protein product [Moneuplotes crassus]|uniref:Uncharacterized protein n=1 Tax=Euplotes crassus TaxID=5936 RepID=A0AAD2DA33_EUPCR|nr:unnamed protein product [Moneuplotes crassus]
MKFPKCDFSYNCAEVRFMVKATEENRFERDVFVCQRCADTVVVKETVQPIPDLATVIEVLDMAEYYMVKIDTFREIQKVKSKEIWLSQWDRLLDDLEEYKEKHRILKENLVSIDLNNSWNELPYLHIEAKEFLDSLIESKLIKQYNHQKNCMKFMEDKYQIFRERNASKAWVNSQICKLRDFIGDTDHGRVLEKLKKTEKLCTQKDQQLEQFSRVIIEKDKTIDLQMGKILYKDNQITLKEAKIKEITKKNESNRQIIRDKNNIISKHIAQIEKLKEENQTLKNLSKNLEKERRTFNKSHSDNFANIQSQNEETKEDPFFLNLLDNSMESSTTLIEPSTTFLTPILESEYDLSSPSSLTSLRDFSNHKFPHLPSLTFTHLHKLPLNSFLESNSFTSINQFSLRSPYGLPFEISPYTKTLGKILPKVVAQVTVYSAVLGNKQFEDLLVAAKNVKTVKFGCCIIETDKKCAFRSRLKGARVQSIDFEGTGYQERSNWGADGCKRFRNIVKGLAEVESIRNRGIFMGLICCGMKKDEVLEILKEFEMDKMIPNLDKSVIMGRAPKFYS